jgi:Flp pilus assembly protein TadG
MRDSVLAIRASRQNESGTAVAEFLFAVPAVLMMFAVIVFAGKMTDMNQRVHETARDAARAASLQFTPDDAKLAAADLSTSRSSAH